LPFYAKRLLLICAKWFVCNALEMFSKISFATQTMLCEFGVLKGQSPLKIMGGQRGEGALYFKYKRGVLLAF
jgi:hypothetical protein